MLHRNYRTTPDQASITPKLLDRELLALPTQPVDPAGPEVRQRAAAFIRPMGELIIRRELNDYQRRVTERQNTRHVEAKDPDVYPDDGPLFTDWIAETKDPDAKREIERLEADASVLPPARKHLDFDQVDGMITKVYPEEHDIQLETYSKMPWHD